MSVLDIKFLDSDSETIYDYLTALTSGGQVTVKIQNLGDESLTDLGLYLTTTSTLGGDIENPPDYTPSAAYQTLIDWGQDSASGAAAQGGLKVTFDSPTDGTEQVKYFSRGDGSSLKTKIKVGYYDSTGGTYNILPSGGVMTIKLELETPPSISSKRLFINLAVA